MDFAAATDGYRRELLAYCYRMLGSVQDAEDVVQEVYLRAWRAFDRYDARRASVRTWLYRIATNACLTALDKLGRAALPTEVFAPSGDPEAIPEPGRDEIRWLQPIPDVLLDPATVADARGGVRLAFITALQHLPARQRAALILRDVLDWRAAEVADLLDTSTASVNSALQRAREQLSAAAPDAEKVAEPDDTARRQVLDRFVTAFVAADMAGLAELLREDVELEMPPSPTWFAGREAVVRFFGARTRIRPDRFRMVPTTANGQPAAAAYRLDESGVHQAHTINVLTMAKAGIAHIVAFNDPGLFRLFGLPPLVR